MAYITLLDELSVLFGVDGRVKLADFGLARILEGSRNCAVSLVGVRSTHAGTAMRD
jgi:hypothetical protein